MFNGQPKANTDHDTSVFTSAQESNMDERWETRSQCSSSSRSSQRSNASVLAAKARAKAEAARAQASFAEKEAEMIKEQAHIEAEATKKKAELSANLHTLRLKSAAAAAIAEAEVLEAAAEDETGVVCFPSNNGAVLQLATDSSTGQQHVNTQAITQVPSACHQMKDCGEFTQNKLKEHDKQLSEISEYEFKELPVDQTPKYNPKSTADHSFAQNSLKNATFTSQPRYPDPVTYDQRLQPPTNRQSPMKIQSRLSPVISANESGASATSDLAKYLIRRELVSSGLLTFDDKPENYWAWKASFHNATEELSLTPREELDLLCKWLGPKSSEQAKRIRAVHIYDATAGVRMLWQRLEDSYGSPEAIENALLKKLEDFPKLTNRENQKLRELGDLLTELDAARLDGFLPGLSYLDTSRGITPIVQKLPHHLQEKWITSASHYKEQYKANYPPFPVFVKFVCDKAKTLNDPSFAPLLCAGSPNVSKPEKQYKPNFKAAVSVHKTDMTTLDSSLGPTDSNEVDPGKHCPLHNKPHSLRKCRGFRAKTLDERKAILKEKHICFKCCSSTSHMAKGCSANIHCNECKSNHHVTALHPGPAPWNAPETAAAEQHGGEQPGSSTPAIISKCTEICGKDSSSRSCSKICLVNIYPVGHKEKAVKAYAVLDEQSNRSLAKTDLFEIFDINTETRVYTLKTCSGVGETRARRADGFMIESLDGKTTVQLPTLIECDMLPDDRSEIPTPEVARHHSHLKHLADKIPSLDPNAAILVLLGRDIPRVHKVREYHNGPNNAPYAQRLDLGWVIIGEVCLRGAHVPNNVSVYCTSVLNNGRASLLEACPNTFHVKEKVLTSDTLSNYSNMGSLFDFDENDSLSKQLFIRTPLDDKPAMSVEDEQFLEIMEEQMFMDETNSWVAPLPFKPKRCKLPNNRDQAVKRLKSLCRMLDKKPHMKEHFFNFMQRMFDSGHAEPAPQLDNDQECWYLPIFGVYHPRKPNQIRVVFDSSATHEDTSLNNVLLSGPDMNNTLLGVLLRFRKEPVAVTADIEQMFYCFVIREDHRDYVRFLWYEDNNPNKAIREYRMTVHVFGNSPSPAIAIYGLRRAALAPQDEYGEEAKQFVLKNFYVDDGLTSFPSDSNAIQTLRNTKEMLADSNIRLHKIASNSPTVMAAFRPEERAKELKNLDFGTEPLPLQRSLGLNWDMQNDCFTFSVSQDDKPFTRRGTLSTVNSLYDPLGFAAPVIMQGKALIRELGTENCEWDTPLPTEKEAQWKSWKNSLVDLEKLQIPRQYLNTSLQSTCQRELCVFADASTLAISAVAYLRAKDNEGHVHVGFCIGKSKLAPRQVHTVPRLELCAAVLAVELGDMLLEELDIEIHKVKYYTDSRVVLGYINNTSRRFYVYVANRVARIRKSTDPSQWHFVSTENNPADHGTRQVPASLLSATNWFTGPDFLSKSDEENPAQPDNFELIEPATDAEVRPQVSTFATKIMSKPLGSHRFENFSSWKRLIRAIARLILKARSISKAPKSNEHTMDAFTQAKLVIVRVVQNETFEQDIKRLNKGEDVSKHSPLKNLNVVLDKEGLMRVGGRVSSAEIPQDQSQPIVIPKRHHIATLLVQFYHDQVAHQGRHITEGAVRSAGLWILGGKRLVSNVINKCTTCRRLRGKEEQQKMADIPADRLLQAPPFTHVGVDVFGPWNICIRRTRGGVLDNKRWAVMFTCLVTRAVHIEVVESLSTSSFINALRRFMAIRGAVKLFRSDRGTNFVGACKELQISCEDPELQSYLKNEACTWKFNPPHSSHMGGVWERMIGVARRILDAMLLKVHSPNLTHEVLVTLMAEVAAIMNGRPLVPVSSDPEQPDLLTPSALLTQKISPVFAPPGDFDVKDLFRKQWRQVQSLADSFWKRWREEYLATLQPRRKWQADQPNLAIGDVVLLKDSQIKRNDWPTGLIVNTYPGRDNRVRKVDVRVVKEGTPKVYTRPISEVVLLVKV